LNGDKGNDFLLGDAGFDILTGGGTDTFTIKIDKELIFLWGGRRSHERLIESRINHL
jgi:hypothetical protein